MERISQQGVANAEKDFETLQKKRAATGPARINTRRTTPAAISSLLLA